MQEKYKSKKEPRKPVEVIYKRLQIKSKLKSEQPKENNILRQSETKLS